MKVALVQVQLDPRCRAANVQAISRAIDRAGRTETGLDLLVLPDDCDTGGASPERMHYASTREGIRALLAFKAREWGVYIAAGLHERTEEGYRRCSVLYDPDGHVVAAAAASGEEEDRTAGCMVYWPTPVGMLGVCVTQAGAVCRVPFRTAGGALVALPLAPSSSGRFRRADEKQVESILNDPGVRGDAYWAIVSPAGLEDNSLANWPGGSFVCAPNGRVIKATSTTDESVLVARVDLAPAEAGV